jgi:hypothetical protein
MSCWILDERRIASLAHHILDLYSTEEELKYARESTWLARRYPAWPIWPGLAKDMMQMNLDAFVARYEGRHMEYVPNVENADMESHPVELFSRVQFFKTLQCYLYQCNEGDIDERPLFKVLYALLEFLSTTVSTNSPEYEAAQWG